MKLILALVTAVVIFGLWKTWREFRAGATPLLGGYQVSRVDRPVLFWIVTGYWIAVYILTIIGMIFLYQWHPR